MGNVDTKVVFRKAVLQLANKGQVSAFNSFISPLFQNQ